MKSYLGQGETLFQLLEPYTRMAGRRDVKNWSDDDVLDWAVESFGEEAAREFESEQN